LIEKKIQQINIVIGLSKAIRVIWRQINVETH